MPPETKMLTVLAASKFVFAAEGDAPSLPKFECVAYTGKMISVNMWGDPIIIDLSGMSIPTQRLPTRRNHSSMLVVGHTETVAVADGKVVGHLDDPTATSVLDVMRGLGD